MFGMPTSGGADYLGSDSGRAVNDDEHCNKKI